MCEERDSLSSLIKDFTMDELVGGLAWYRTLRDQYIEDGTEEGLDGIELRVSLLEAELEHRSSGQ